MVNRAVETPHLEIRVEVFFSWSARPYTETAGLSGACLPISPKNPDAKPEVARVSGRRGKERRSPFNYLEWLDQKALALPPAQDWLGKQDEQYGQFMLARYPSLRPADRPLAEKLANHTWAAWVSKIATRESSCLDRLDADQKTQLAALVMETVKAVDDRKRQHLKVSLIRHLQMKRVGVIGG